MSGVVDPAHVVTEVRPGVVVCCRCGAGAWVDRRGRVRGSGALANPMSKCFGEERER